MNRPLVLPLAINQFLFFSPPLFFSSPAVLLDIGSTIYELPSTMPLGMEGGDMCGVCIGESLFILAKYKMR